MKKLNIKRFATSDPGSDTFEINIHYTENYNQAGYCNSVTVLVTSSIAMSSVERNGVDVAEEWNAEFPTTTIQKVYTENTTETLTFSSRYGEEITQTIDIISIDAQSVIGADPAIDANIKINPDIKIEKLSLKEIDETVSTLFDLIYPIGSIYYTNDANFSPNVSFNGTWEQIKDVFLLAAGNTYIGGTSGGSATHTHEAGSLYANIGSPTGNAAALGFSSTGWHGTNSTYSVGGNGSSAPGHPGRSHDTSVGGTTGSGSSLPPYIVVYVWKRVS